MNEAIIKATDELALLLRLVLSSECYHCSARSCILRIGRFDEAPCSGQNSVASPPRPHTIFSDDSLLAPRKNGRELAC